MKVTIERVMPPAEMTNDNYADADTLRSLIQELADFQKMSDRPKIGANQLSRNLKEGTANALLIFVKKDGSDDEKREVAGYAIYYLSPSTQFCKNQHVLFAEDVYIRPQFRRQKLGRQLMRELASIASDLCCPVMMWNVLLSNRDAISFYFSIGAKDLTNEVAANVFPKIICWRIEQNQFDSIISTAGNKKMSNIRMTVFNDKEPIDDKNAQGLAEHWLQLCSDDNDEKDGNRSMIESDSLSLTKLFRDGNFGSVIVQRDTDSNPEPEVLGMALFHRRAYSTWLGPYLTIDQIRVRHDHRRKGIGTKLGVELVKIAKNSNHPRIGWTAPEDTHTEAFFRSLGAVNLTELEGWLLFQWNYKGCV